MTEQSDNLDNYVENRYNEAIDYYWEASRNNKRAYKLTRSLTIILGALVTLVASLSSASFIIDKPFWDGLFKLGTPILAASLTIIAGFSQSFQWGATWQDMVLTAQTLQKERDRYLITKPEDRDLAKEVALLNDFVLVESISFFERMLGSARLLNKDDSDTQAKSKNKPKAESTGKAVPEEPHSKT